MKKLNLILFILLTVFFVGCEKDKSNVIIKSSITPNSLSDLSATTFVLNRDNAADNFQTFKWTSVNYGFTASEKFTIQFDLKANNFSSPANLLTVTHDTTASITVGDLNKAMLTAGLSPDVAATLQFRIKTMIHDSIPAIYSNIFEASVTPYATTFPPIFMTGAATGGWGWGQYVYKELRSTAPNIYQTIGYFLSGEAFRFFKQTDWNPVSWNYPYFTGTVSALFVNALDGDSNFKFTGTSGYYQVTVNMTTKSVDMVAMPDQVLFATGAALGGWDWSTNYIQLTWKSNGIYQATTDFVVETFRFFGQKDWGPTGYNYPWFAGGTVSALFENANDGDKNFKFIGTPGSYTVTVNLIDKTVTMTQP
jgi:hypothetical protein